MHYRFIQFLIILCLAANSLQAGVKVISKNKSLGCDSKASDGQTTMYLRPDIMRIDMEDKESNISLIFKKSDEKMWILNHSEKSYQVITSEDMQRISDKLNTMKKMMDEQLSKLPEDQREQAKSAMMRYNASIYEEKPVVTYERKDEKQKIGQWDCVRYDYLENKKQKGVYWVASLEQVKVNENDFQITRDFSNMIKENFEMFSLGAATSMMSPEQSFEGFPVRSVFMEEGKDCMINTLESIQEMTMDNKLFQIPDGYGMKAGPMKDR